jgi:enoyl-CoA hydratase
MEHVYYAGVDQREQEGAVPDILIGSEFFSLQNHGNTFLLSLRSTDGTNRLTKKAVLALGELIENLSADEKPLVITGNNVFFSAGADLKEIAAIDGPSAREFSEMGQSLMRSVEQFPAPVFAAISGYCMGGGLDLALACHHRIAAHNAVFGHRGAALGLITGWGGTQRLPRLVGKGVALEMFVAAEKVSAQRAFEIGLVEAVVDDPLAAAFFKIEGAQGHKRA